MHRTYTRHHFKRLTHHLHLLRPTTTTTATTTTGRITHFNTFHATSSFFNMAPSISSTQLAVQVTAYGKPAKVLSITTNASVPQPADNEVLVQVRAVGVNSADWKIVEGQLAAFFKLTFPFTVGGDLSGVVVAVGSQVKRLKVGDEVYNWKNLTGAYAEYVTIPEVQLSLKPKSLTHTEAASIPAVALTSYQALTRHGKLQAGQKVLVLGGSGGTGSVAVQLAKALGASEVAATTSSKNSEFVKSLGATLVIAYDQKQWQEELAGANYDIVYDTVGESTAYEHSAKVLKKGGVFISLVSMPPKTLDPEKPTFARMVLSNGSQQAREELDEIAKLIDQGKVKVSIQKVYELKDVVQMYETISSGRVRGKLVMNFDVQKYLKQ